MDTTRHYKGTPLRDFHWWEKILVRFAPTTKLRTADGTLVFKTFRGNKYLMDLVED